MKIRENQPETTESDEACSTDKWSCRQILLFTPVALLVCVICGIVYNYNDCLHNNGLGPRPIHETLELPAPDDFTNYHPRARFTNEETNQDCWLYGGSVANTVTYNDRHVLARVTTSTEQSVDNGEEPLCPAGGLISTGLYSWNRRIRYYHNRLRQQHYEREREAEDQRSRNELINKARRMERGSAN